MTSEIQFLCTSCFLFVAILCPALNLVTTAVQRAKFSLANTVLITSPTQTFLLLHSQLTSKQQNEPKLCSVMCDQPDFKGSCSFPLCLYIPLLIFHRSGKRLFPRSYTLPIYRPLYWIHNLALKKNSSLYWLSSHPLAFLRCPSKKQPVLSALPATEPNMDCNPPGSSGAFSFLVRPRWGPHFHEGSHQSSAPFFSLTACLLWPYPSQRAWGVLKGFDSASSHAALQSPSFSIHSFLWGPGHLSCTILSNITIVLYCSVHYVERFV